MNRMNKLIIVRHGESEQHVSNITGGWTDVALTEKGILQAHQTGIRLTELMDGSFKFISSDLKRASQTSLEIEKSVSVVPHFFPQLRESNNGDAANLSKDQAVLLYKEPTVPILDWIPYPNAESWNMMRERIHSFLDTEIDNKFNYLIVSHANAIVEIINWYLKLSLDESNVSFDIDPCSITILYQNEWGENTINRLNDTSHLQA